MSDKMGVFDGYMLSREDYDKLRGYIHDLPDTKYKKMLLDLTEEIVWLG